MIRTALVDYDDQIRQEHEEVEVNDDRCDEILSIIYNYLGEIIARCNLSRTKRKFLYNAFDFIEDALNNRDIKEEDDT